VQFNSLFLAHQTYKQVMNINSVCPWLHLKDEVFWMVANWHRRWLRCIVFI